MVRSAYLKTVFRTIRDNLGRFIAVTLIILLGIAFVSGLGTLSYKMERSLADAYDEAASPDIMIKSTSLFGISSSVTEQVEAYAGVKAVQSLTVIDTAEEAENVRVVITDLADQKVNRLSLVEGRLPESGTEVVAERASDEVKAHAVGDKVTVMGQEMTVVGIVANAMYSYRGGEPMLTEDLAENEDGADFDESEMEKLQQIFYADASSYGGFLPVTDLYVFMDYEEARFGDAYDEAAEADAAALEALLADDSLVFMTLEDTMSYALAQSYAGKLDVIAAFFPAFFIAVSALVVLSTMTRMIEEDRPAIGCYRTIGYKDGMIAAKYLFFSAVCCLIGSGGGLGVGLTLLPAVIYPAFNTMFFVPAWEQWVQPLMGIIAAVVMLLAVAAVTLYLIRKELRCAPAEVLRPKTPKAGKKIFLEYIPVLWKRLSFRFKSTFRNIFRYGKNLVMTVISVAGSTAIVLAGMGLSDTCRADDIRNSFPKMADAVSAISAVVIIFAALLCILVIYNLTNMNIAERKRELATLKVLGYREAEVCMYIFREILIMAVMGIIVGIPLGYGILYFMLGYLDFGSVQDVMWYSYLFTPVFVLFIIGIVDVLLRFKIKKIDMTSSLKTVE